MVLTHVEAQRRSRALRGLVRDLGFPSPLVTTNYRVLTEAAGEVAVDIAAFGRLPHDMSNAVLVGEVESDTGYAREQALAAAVALAAPLTVVASATGLELLDTSSRKHVHRIDYGEQPSDRLRDELQPERLLAAKSNPHQLSLFPVDVKLLAKARQSAIDRLRNRVVDAKLEIKQAAKEWGSTLTRTDVARVVVDALTALFIEDKFQVPYQSDNWWLESHTRFKELAENLRSLSPAIEPLYHLAYARLRDGINYQSLDSVVVSDLYEPRLVDPGDRDEYGVVYTPYELATRVLERLPIEIIDPKRRHVLDIACGSGTLLLAASDRLTNAMPAAVSPGRMHSYLLRHLQGWDRDPFAVRLAHLSLTVHGHPLGNGWQIKQQDTLTPEAKSDATIIVGNPPWQGRRSGHPGAPSRSRDDAADPFVRKALSLLPDDGLLGLLLPASWLTANHSAETRKLLSQRCQILEVWRLPEGTFPPAQVKGAVVIAQAKPTGKRLGHYLSRSIRNKTSLQYFYTTGRSDRTLLVKSDNSRDLGSSSPVTDWIRKTNGQLLGGIFQVRSGPPKGHGGGIGPAYRWLGNVRKMRHFGIVDSSEAELARYPGDFDRRAGWPVESAYGRPKVLISRVSKSNTPWKVKVGFALDPLIPSNNQYALTVREEWLKRQPQGEEMALLYAVGAVMGSALVCAWLNERVSTGNVRSDVLRELPLPDGWEALAGRAQRLAEMVSSGADRHVISAAARGLDTAVFNLYGTPPWIRKAVVEALAGEQAREGVVRYPVEARPAALNELPETHRVSRDGCVLAVTDDAVTLWVDGITPDEGTLMQIPEGLPAAALLPGASFKVTCSPHDLSGGDFRLHLSSYLDDDGLVAPWAP